MTAFDTKITKLIILKAVPKHASVRRGLLRIAITGLGLSCQCWSEAKSSLAAHSMKEGVAFNLQAATFKHQFPSAAGGSDVEISGWEARHALQMLAEDNPTVIGLLSSPETYVPLAGRQLWPR